MTHHRFENQEQGQRGRDRGNDNRNQRNRGPRGQREAGYERDRMANEGGWQREVEPVGGQQQHGSQRGHDQQHSGWQPSGSQGKRGRFTGRGPKGWQRSDEHVLEDVNQALTYHGDIDASDVEVTCQSGEIVLRGSVSDRRTKRLAEIVVENIPGVKDVRNELRVTPT